MLMLLDYRVRQRDFLLEISRAITAQLDLSEVLKRVLNASVVMLGGTVGLITLRDVAGDYRIRATVGIDSERYPELNEQLSKIFELEMPAFDALDAQLREMAALLDKRLRQSFALPLVFAGEPLGLLVVFRSVVTTATPDDIQVLQSFADQASIAVHNAQLYERIDHERKQLAAIVQYSADGVMILDARGRIVSFNHALERMTAWHADDAIGLDYDEVFEWKRRDSTDLKEALDHGYPFTDVNGANNKTLYVEGDLLRRDGMSISIGILYAPLLSADGHLTNIIANVRDITNFRKAQEMQNVFISTISHELKTPVALIKGHAATLRREDVDWDTAVVREYSGVIEEEADRLNVLIENLLTTSKIHAQRRLELNLDDVRLNHVCASAAERFSTQTRKHTLIVDFPDDYPVIQADEQRLRQVIDNLLSNAIKYSPEGGEIRVGGYFTDDTVSVFVKDQGVGISEADQERVFERFFRVDGKLSRRTQGTGLGLFLARSIVEAHGGQITVESQPGKGSTFTFTLPQQ
ncbi:MAG: PAS domain S-box protein [Chloroflexi bacterium]|nr:PAS domain S-box protein [Chloroflexota bacterium]